MSQRKTVVMTRKLSVRERTREFLTTVTTGVPNQLRLSFRGGTTTDSYSRRRRHQGRGPSSMLEGDSSSPAASNNADNDDSDDGESSSLMKSSLSQPTAGWPQRTRRQTISIISNNIDRYDEPLSGLFSFMCVGLSWFLVFLFFPFSLCFCLKVIREYERAVVFRIGRLIDGGTRGPGLFFTLPCVDSYRKIDLRVVSFDVPPQEILSKDSVTVTVDAVIYFHISNPAVSVTNVNDAAFSTKLLAQTTLRNILGTKTLAEMLSERDAMAVTIQKILDEGTDPWGVKVDRVEVKDIRLPHQLMRAMAAEAEAARDARARVIAAEGEQKASGALYEAALTISHSRTALQLRYLQTLASIATEHSSTILFPVPVQLLQQQQKEKEGSLEEAFNAHWKKAIAEDFALEEKTERKPAAVQFETN